MKSFVFIWKRRLMCLFFRCLKYFISEISFGKKMFYIFQSHLLWYYWWSIHDPMWSYILVSNLFHLLKIFFFFSRNLTIIYQCLSSELIFTDSVIFFIVDLFIYIYKSVHSHSQFFFFISAKIKLEKYYHEIE